MSPITMKNRTLVFALTAAIVFGLGAAGWLLVPIYSIKNNVKKNLIDPESAQFTDITFHRDTGSGCGFVNSKNGMGGYVGRTGFISFSDKRVMFEPKGVVNFDKRLAYCEGLKSDFSRAKKCLEEMTIEINEVETFMGHQSKQCPK